MQLPTAGNCQNSSRPQRSAEALDFHRRRRNREFQRLHACICGCGSDSFRVEVFAKIIATKFGVRRVVVILVFVGVASGEVENAVRFFADAGADIGAMILGDENLLDRVSVDKCGEFFDVGAVQGQAWHSFSFVGWDSVSR